MNRALSRRYGHGGRATSVNADHLFVGVFPAGISYADRSREEHGDYMKVAFLPFDSLELVVYKPKSPLLALIRADAAKIAARRGESYQVSSSGQTVRLGGR